MIEIERKFLVNTSLLPALTSYDSKEFHQGYLSSAGKNTIRIRLADQDAFLTIKGKTVGLSRAEFEYEIPFNEAQEMLKLCGDQKVEKTRYFIPQENLTWEVDFFHGKLKGLILAEIELSSEDQQVELPNWISKEVSHDAQYFNSNLSSLSDEDAKRFVCANIPE